MGDIILSCGCNSKDGDKEAIFASWDGSEDFDGGITREYGYVCREHFEKYGTIGVLAIEETDFKQMDEQDEFAQMDREELNKIITGALLDFFSFLAVGGENEEFKSKMFANFPTIEDLERFARERGLFLKEERTHDWNKIFQ
jgi:hypothetical protein